MSHGQRWNNGQMRTGRDSRTGPAPTVAHSIALLAGDTGGQSADNSDFTVCIIRCGYRAELILGR